MHFGAVSELRAIFRLGKNTLSSNYFVLLRGGRSFLFFQKLLNSLQTSRLWSRVFERLKIALDPSTFFFLLTVQRWFLYWSSLYCNCAVVSFPCLFLVSSPFSTQGRLCFVLVILLYMYNVFLLFLRKLLNSMQTLISRRFRIKTVY